MIIAGDPIVLDGYAAKQCPVRTHNNFSPSVCTIKEECSEEQQAVIDAGKAFEAEIFAELINIHPTAVLVGELPDSRRNKSAVA